MNPLADKLYVHGSAETRELHWWLGHKVLVSDNRANILGIIGETFAQDDRHIIEVTPEELRRLILEQWEEGTHYLTFWDSPPLRPGVDIEGRSAMDYRTRVSLADYLTSRNPEESQNYQRPAKAA